LSPAPIGPDDLTLDPASVAAQITSRTKAIVAVHYAGFACRMDELSALADAHGVPIIEDCAHALFTSYRGAVLGLHGRIGCFSFFSNKNATCGEGGALITDDPALAERLRLLRCHGMTSPTLERHRGRAYSYDVAMPGFNYRLDEMRAALLRVQLRRLPSFLARRRELFRLYAERLEETPVVLPFSGERRQDEYEYTAIHILPVILPEGSDRLAVMGRLKEAGIQTSIHYPPVHSFSAYRDDGQHLPRTEALAARQLTLPLYPAMRDEDVDTVVTNLLRSLRV
jgi:dTDP-4-amino-4,6-dideoxygalactose transaminase